MKNVRVLDCTLRDGGRIINCEFPDKEIYDIADRLANSKIDIIEVGFLRDHRTVNYQGNSTFFTDTDQIKKFIDKKKHPNTMFVAFIDFGMFDFDSLKPYDGKSIDGIRFGFTKKNYEENKEEIYHCARIIKDKGYKLFIQGVNSLNYSDKELLDVIDTINDIKPYSFGIVDTYGAMYMDDVDRIYGLVDHNMDEDICIDFHSHNNYQLSFAFAQEIIKLSKGTRKVIIDGTLDGMGKVAGNLNLELIVDYLIRKMHYDYEFDDILDIIDDHIAKYKADHQWGYSIPAMLAGIYKSHPNNIIYLTEKYRLETKDIKNLISMIDPQKRQRYDYDNIQQLYMQYIAEKIDDHEALEKIKNVIAHKKVLVLSPGNTINTHKHIIEDFIKQNHPVIFSVNYVSGYAGSYAFFGNHKRYANSKRERINRKVIVTSNIKPDDQTDIVVNYDGVINRGYKYFENSTIMLLNLLKKTGVADVTIAGFDGFDSSLSTNYLDNTFDEKRNILKYDEVNEDVGNQFRFWVEALRDKCRIKMLTPSIYEREIR